jgi:hypothetical protein
MMKKAVEEENKMDRVLNELGDLYEFNRKIKEFKFVNREENPPAVKENSPSYDSYRKSGEGSE